jgi:methionyl-tRNA formyltransferase
MNANKKILLVGDGWGAVAALRSLIDFFSQVSVCSTDIDVLNIAEEHKFLVRDVASFHEDELCICAGYKKIISSEVVEKQKILNIHYSLLPSYRGLHSTVWAVINGEEKHGLTIHVMNKCIDDGPIVYQYSFRDEGYTSTEIIEMCNLHIEKNLGLILTKYIDGEITPRAQDVKLATWVCKRNLEDCLINFNWDVSMLRRFFRALVRPYPLPMICVKSRIYEVENAEVIEKDYQMTNGRVVNQFGGQVFIKINGGLLIFDRLIDIESKQSIPAADLLKTGMRLC